MCIPKGLCPRLMTIQATAIVGIFHDRADIRDAALKTMLAMTQANADAPLYVCTAVYIELAAVYRAAEARRNNAAI